MAAVALLFIPVCKSPSETEPLSYPHLNLLL